MLIVAFKNINICIYIKSDRKSNSVVQKKKNIVIQNIHVFIFQSVA